MSKEARRTGAQFLNGLAIAVLTAGTLGPLVSGNAQLGVAIISLTMGGVLHGLALMLARHEGS